MTFKVQRNKVKEHPSMLTWISLVGIRNSGKTPTIVRTFYMRTHDPKHRRNVLTISVLRRILLDGRFIQQLKYCIYLLYL